VRREDVGSGQIKEHAENHLKEARRLHRAPSFDEVEMRLDGLKLYIREVEELKP